MRAKIAYIGGGSLFVPSIINGIGQVMKASPLPFEAELSLFDIVPEKAEKMKAYGEVVRKAWGIQLETRVTNSRREALEGADAAIVSVWLQEEHEKIDRLWKRLGVEYPEDGLAVAAWAAACTPWSLEVAKEMEEVCPKALFLTLMNPTDVMAGYIGRATAMHAAGLCVEVDGLRGALAYYLRVPAEQIDLIHAGVNHDGWVLKVNVNGQDGYCRWGERLKELSKDPDFHPGNRGIQPILDLTGRLRSSAYHNWPLEVERLPEEAALWEKWQGKRESFMTAVEEAIRAGIPISDPPRIHPERSWLNYPFTGVTVGKLVQSFATGLANTIPLQIRNQGAIANFPEETFVEVPALVKGKVIQGLAVGALPEWLGGVTRLLAIQRKMLIDYLLDRNLVTLKRALSVLPLFASVQALNRYAQAIHDDLVVGCKEG